MVGHVQGRSRGRTWTVSLLMLQANVDSLLSASGVLAEHLRAAGPPREAIEHVFLGGHSDDTTNVQALRAQATDHFTVPQDTTSGVVLGKPPPPISQRLSAWVHRSTAAGRRAQRATASCALGRL